MRLITRRTLERFAERHPTARGPLGEWCTIVEAARWRDADHLRETSPFPARPIGGRRVVFNVKGNDFRIIVSVQYADPSRDLNGIVRVHFVGTHAEYDRIDAESVDSAAP